MEAIAEVGGKVLLDDAAEEAGERGGDGYQNPDQRGEDHTDYGDGFERDGYGMGLAEANVEREDVRDELDPMNNDGGQKEGHDRQRADNDEKDVDGTGDCLTAAAVGALNEVLLVVGAHGRREGRDIVAPAGENISYHLIGAGGVVLAAVGGEGYRGFFHLLIHFILTC